MSTTTYDWTKFTKRILIDTTLEQAYFSFASRKGMESWFLRLCEYKRNDINLNPEELAIAGDIYKFLWHGWPDSTVENGSIILADGCKNFGFTFNGNGANSMEVFIELSEMNTGCMVALTQINIPNDIDSMAHWHLGCLEGWTFYLTNLKSILEGGIDLRNKNSAINGVINA